MLFRSIMWDRWKHLYKKSILELGLTWRCASVRSIGVEPSNQSLLQGKEDEVFPLLLAAWKLAPALAARAKRVIAYGEAAARIEADLAAHVPLDRLGSSFEEVMRRAREVAAPGDAVLLSPACSSYDMFTNYEERGAIFRRLAKGQA